MFWLVGGVVLNLSPSDGFEGRVGPFGNIHKLVIEFQEVRSSSANYARISGEPRSPQGFKLV